MSPLRAEPLLALDAPAQPEGLVEIPCTGSAKLFVVNQGMVERWKLDFPGVDVLAQLRAMRAWSEANTSKRKTHRGMAAFIVRWLTKEQDKSASVARAAGAGRSEWGSR